MPRSYHNISFHLSIKTYRNIWVYYVNVTMFLIHLEVKFEGSSVIPTCKKGSIKAWMGILFSIFFWSYQFSCSLSLLPIMLYVINIYVPGSKVAQWEFSPDRTSCIRHNATRTEAAFEAQAKNIKEPEVDTAFFPR